MLTMVIMMITGLATFCYSRVRMQVKSGLTFVCRWRQEPNSEFGGSSQPQVTCIERLGGLLNPTITMPPESEMLPLW